MDGLKSCPFCGGKARLQGQITMPGAVSVVCMNEKCGAHVFFYGADFSREGVRRRWNRRKEKEEET